MSAQCQIEPHLLLWQTSNINAYCPYAEPRFPITPETALQLFERRSERQAVELRGYTATTLISVELPDMSRWGAFELQRVYMAPKTLVFTPVRFTGDSFVKTNVIARLLQSEIDHLRDPQFATAINSTNYKITHKRTAQIEGRLVYAYQLKPRKRRVGLFEGQMFLDAFNGSLVRKQGRLAKTPSFVLKRIDFWQDYIDIGGFTFLSHTHSTISARLIGRTLVDIHHKDYRFPTLSSAVVGDQKLPETDTTLPEAR